MSVGTVRFQIATSTNLASLNETLMKTTSQDVCVTAICIKRNYRSDFTCNCDSDGFCSMAGNFRWDILVVQVGISRS